MKDKFYFMRMAMRLALRAKGQTSPNPMVGAVIVKDGKVIGKGYHKKAGLPHAEIVALEEAKEKSKGATLYVTLEPCVHFGRTPPCVYKIIESKIKKVVIGMIDPNPLNNGKGIAILKRHGIEVEVGILEKELRKMNEAFIKYITKNLPFVVVKVGQSLDGKIATFSGDSRWITSDLSRAYVHRLRKEFDAIMVGVNTIIRDNPHLDSPYSSHPVKIVVVDSHLSTPCDAQIFKNPQVILATLPPQSGQETENRKLLSKKALLLEVKEKAGQVNLKDMLKKLAKKEITSILVEGGGTLIGSLFDEDLVDKVLFFISPKIIGGKEAISSVMGKGVSRVDKAFRLKDVRIKRFGEDILVEGYIH